MKANIVLHAILRSCNYYFLFKLSFRYYNYSRHINDLILIRIENGQVFSTSEITEVNINNWFSDKFIEDLFIFQLVLFT